MSRPKSQDIPATPCPKQQKRATCIKFLSAISRRRGPGCPRNILPKNFMFRLFFRAWPEPKKKKNPKRPPRMKFTLQNLVFLPVAPFGKHTHSEHEVMGSKAKYKNKLKIAKRTLSSAHHTRKSQSQRHSLARGRFNRTLLTFSSLI